MTTSIYNYRGAGITDDKKTSGELKLNLPFPIQSDHKNLIKIETHFIFNSINTSLMGEYDPESKKLELNGVYYLDGWWGTFRYTDKIKLMATIQTFNHIKGVFESPNLGKGKFDVSYQLKINQMDNIDSREASIFVLKRLTEQQNEKNN